MRRPPVKTRKPADAIDWHVGKRVRMRRLMLGMSQTKLGDALGLTFQQVQKYEKGINRIGASRLQQLAHVLQVSVPFFFDGNSVSLANGARTSRSNDYVFEFLASSDGLALTKAYMQIKNPTLQRRIVDLVEHIADDRD